MLYPIGGVARLESIPGGWAELSIALAGPAVNVALAGGAALMLTASHVPHPFQQAMPWQNTGLVQKLLWANITLVVFNMIPAFPMDGGRVLRGLLVKRVGRAKATRIATAVGKWMAVAFAIFGLITFNLILILIAAFVYMGASSELEIEIPKPAPPPKKRK